jgi:outer membrane scaffolding protein for murein synthesis (MipA/OmpV family)
MSGEDRKESRYNDNGSDWTVDAGAMALFKPEYEGSDDYEFTWLPILDIRYKKTFFLDPRRGIGVYLLDRAGWRLGISAGYRFGRDEDDSGDLRGLGDVDGGVTANIFAEWKTGNFMVNTRFEQQFTEEDTGYLLDIGAGYTFRISKEFSLKPSVKATYAGPDYMGSFFGISKKQSSRSGLPAYEADAGIKTVGTRLFVLYRLNRHWDVQCSASYKILTDSPVVKDENQFIGSLGLSYRF